MAIGPCRDPLLLCMVPNGLGTFNRAARSAHDSRWLRRSRGILCKSQSNCSMEGCNSRVASCWVMECACKACKLVSQRKLNSRWQLELRNAMVHLYREAPHKLLSASDCLHFIPRRADKVMTACLSPTIAWR